MPASRTRLLWLLGLVCLGLLLFWWRPWTDAPSSMGFERAPTDSDKATDKDSSEAAAPSRTREVTFEVQSCEGPSPAELTLKWTGGHQRLVTDQQGQVTATLPATSIQVSTQINGHRANGLLLATQNRFTLTACQPAILELQVLDLTFKPVADMPLQLFKGDTLQEEQRTNAEGRIQFEVTDFQIDTLFFERRLPLRPLKPGEHRTLTLHHGMRSIRGWVLNADGDPVGNAVVELSLPPSFGSTQSVLTDSEGAFLFSAAPPSALLIRAEHPEFGQAELALSETLIRTDRTLTLHLSPQAWLTVHLPPGLQGRAIHLSNLEGDHAHDESILREEDAFFNTRELWMAVRSNGTIPTSANQEKLSISDFWGPPEEEGTADYGDAPPLADEYHDGAAEDPPEQNADSDGEATEDHAQVGGEDWIADPDSTVHMLNHPIFGETLAYSYTKIKGLNGDEFRMQSLPYDPPQTPEVEALLKALGDPFHRSRLDYISSEDVELNSSRTISEGERVTVNPRTPYWVRVLVEVDEHGLYLYYDCGTIDLSPGEELELHCGRHGNFGVKGRILLPDQQPVKNTWFTMDCPRNWTYVFRTNAQGYFEFGHTLATDESCTIHAAGEFAGNYLITQGAVPLEIDTVTDMGDISLKAAEQSFNMYLLGLQQLGGSLIVEGRSMRFFVPPDPNSVLFNAGVEDNAVVLTINGEVTEFQSESEALEALAELESPVVLFRNPNGELVELVLEPGWQTVETHLELDF